MANDKAEYKEYMIDGKDWIREKVFVYLCDHLATSSKGVGSIITLGKSELGSFPTYSTIMQWMVESQELSDKYACAKEAQADFMADEMLEIADDGRNDWMSEEGREGTENFKLNGEHVQRSRLRIDSRKWLASKLKPKRYGEKIQQDVVVTTKIEDMTDEELDEYIQSKSK